MKYQKDRAIGKWNDAYIRKAALKAKREGGTFICGWGAHGKFLQRSKWVCARLQLAGVDLHALWSNKDGSPKHPLYIAMVEKPKLWEPIKLE